MTIPDFTADHYTSGSVGNASFAKTGDFGFVAEHIEIDIVSGTGEIDISFDGTNIHDKIQLDTKFDGAIYGRRREEIYTKSATGTEVVRIKAWRNHNQVSDVNGR